jgi:bacterioferritin-associated ferredoxin
VYICLCNALTEHDVERAAAGGARRPREVYDSCNSRVQCGSCTAMILCALRTLIMERTEEAAAAMPTAAT